MPTPSAPASPELSLAADLGGTSLVCGVVDAAGGVRARARRPSRATSSANAVVANLIAGLQEVRSAAGLESPVGIGIGCPGIVYADRGIVHRAANLPALRDVPLAALVGEHFGAPTYVAHDVDMALLAEQRLGAGRGQRNILCITVGTGIGLGLMIDGLPVTGANAGAGNLGHLVLDADTPPDECSGRGYLESRASGPAVRDAGTEALRADDSTCLRDLCGGDPERLDAAMVFAAARRGDEVSARIIARVAHLLGVAVANLVNLLDPEIVIVGGGLAQAGPTLFGPLTRTARDYVCDLLRDRVHIVPAQLGDEAGLIGAGLAAWHAGPQSTSPASATHS